MLTIVERTKLDPFTRQIQAVARQSKDPNNPNGPKITVLTWLVTIDGLRLNAQRTGEYAGQTKVEWCDSKGQWVDVWLSKEFPAAARVGVHRKGFKEPLYAVANWDAYCQTVNIGQGKTAPTQFWRKMGPHMLAKTAEALALRKAFPQELSGLYIEEEVAAMDIESEPILNPNAPVPTYKDEDIDAYELERERKMNEQLANPPKQGDRKKDETFGWMIYHGGLWTVDPDQSDPKPDFMEYKITCMKTEMFKDKKLSELTEEQLIDLKDNWIDQYAEKIDKDPVKKECADNIKKAIAWWGEQRK